MNSQIKKLFPVGLIALVAFILGLLAGGMLPAANSLAGSAGLGGQLICDTSTLSNHSPTGLVNTELLYLRSGPGLTYTPITLLEGCTNLTLIGRDSNRAWLQVSLSGNRGGWVFAGYVRTQYNLNALKVTTGAGGAFTPTPAGNNNSTSGVGGGSDSGRSVSVLIDGNQAAAFIKQMPANADLSATLSPSGDSGKGVAVATGRTDANGNLTLTFTMPAKWADGSAVTSGSMVLTMVADGVTLVANLVYYVY